MAENADEVVVAASGNAYFAPVGSTLPTDATTAVDSAFVEAGYLTEDGATLTVGSEVTDYNAWQSLQPIRREKTAQTITLAIVLEQWNEETVPFAFGGGEVVETAAGVYQYSFPQAGDSLDERSLVLDAIDGDTVFRYVFPRGNVTEAVEVQYQRGATANLPLTFSVLEPLGGGSPGSFYTDSVNFALT